MKRVKLLEEEHRYGAVASANLYPLVETANRPTASNLTGICRGCSSGSYLRNVEDYKAMVPWSIKKRAQL